MQHMFARKMSLIMVAAAAFCSAATAAADTIELARNGKTDYRIIAPAEPTKVDGYAVDALAHYLKWITGADFPVVAPGDVDTPQHCIFLGMSEPARRALGETPLAALDDQQHVVRSIDGNIYLYGNGIHANLWAVMEFLEGTLGWRWYSVHDKPHVQSAPDIALDPYTFRGGEAPDEDFTAPMPTVMLDGFHRTRGFTFAYRQPRYHYGRDFFYQHGANMGFTEKGWDGDGLRPSKMKQLGRGHSLPTYIPATPDAHRADYFDWLEKRNYFETNPEFFTEWRNGKRVPDRQLCFSNDALRAELTRNILRHIEHAAPKGEAPYMVNVGANDTPGHFCYCDDCQALEDKYHSPGGPIYDYLIELGGVLQDAHPRALVRTLAYRFEQTQEPPTLPAGVTWPANVAMDFAPIDDPYFADWWHHRHDSVQATYHDMLTWGRLSDRLWAWLYPNPWRTGSKLPVGNVERITNQMRLMHYAGVERVFTDHNLTRKRGNFVELQQYLLVKLMQDVNVDTDALIAEFTGNFYGSAAPTMRHYIDELEQARIDMDLPLNVRYKSNYYDMKTFPYLTTENIHRWQRYFDRMVEQTADQPRAQFHVRMERRELDAATLWRWNALQSAHPNYFSDHEPIVERLRTVDQAVVDQAFCDAVAPANGRRLISDGLIERFLLPIEAGKADALLPDMLEGVSPSRVRQIARSNHIKAPSMVADPDAAFGYATVLDNTDLPFEYGFHQSDKGERVSSHRIERDQIQPGEYRVYEIGEAPMTPGALVYVGGWKLRFVVGRDLHEPNGDNAWTGYLSLKFEGEKFGGTGEARVLCDRVIFVKQ